MSYKQIAEEIINGKRLARGEDVSFLLEGDLQELEEAADQIRSALCGSRVDLCTIINGRAGRCGENCKFCAQSAHHHTGAEEYDFLEEEKLLEACGHNDAKGVHKFSIVTAGYSLSGKAFEKACHAYKRMHEECPGMQLCGSHGFLSLEQFLKLKESGVTMYHDNIETSRRYFPQICTTHTFDEKLECIRRAQQAGLKICSGGIIGMGETWEDRIDMAFTLSELSVDSIPLNALIPIKGTPLEDQRVLTEEEILRTVVIFRFLNPTADVRLAAGRTLMSENGRRAFTSGANATLTGDMLTTSGNNIAQDIQMLTEIGFDLSRQNA